MATIDRFAGNTFNFLRWKRVTGGLVSDLPICEEALPVFFVAAPSALSATLISSTRIDLAWTNNSGGGSLFTIQISTSADFLSGVTEVTGVGTTIYAATGLTENTTYYFRVKAVLGVQSSPWSNTEIEATPNPFTFTVDTTKAGSASDTFVLPFENIGTYNCFVETEDGVDHITIYNQAEVTHVFGSSGSKTFKIWGTMGAWVFNNAGDKLKMIDVSQWGDFNHGNQTGAFRGCLNLDISATDSPDFTGHTSIAGFFYDCKILIYNSSIANWDVSGISNFANTFTRCHLFNQSIDDWNTSNMVQAGLMFYQCTIFNQPLASWDVSNLEDAGQMFESCSAFNQPLNAWNTSSLTQTDSMLENCSVFNQDLDNWDVSNVTTFNSMFNNCFVFNGDITTWVTSSAVNFSNIVSRCYAFNQDVGGWDVSSVTSFSQAFSRCTVFNQDIGGWDTSSAVSFSNMFYNCDAFNQDIGGWDVSGVTNFGSMFNGCLVFNQNLNLWDVSAGTAFNSMFERCAVFNGNITTWSFKLTGTITFGNMFYGCDAFNKDLSGWNTERVTNMSLMFYSCDVFDQDLGGWDIQSLTNATNMFFGVTLSTANYDSLLEGWEANTHNSGVVFSGGNSTYTSASAADLARATLIGTDGWTITDGGGI